MKITNRDNMVVFLQKEPCEKKDPIFTVNNIEAAFEAMQILSMEAYKLWCYFDSSPKGRTMVFSLDDVVEWGIKESSFYESMDELKKVGYISDLGEDAFIFYEFLMDDNEDMSGDDAEAAT